MLRMPTPLNQMPYLQLSPPWRANQRGFRLLSKLKTTLHELVNLRTLISTHVFLLLIY